MNRPAFVFMLGMASIAAAGLLVAGSTYLAAPVLFYLSFPLGVFGFTTAAIGLTRAEKAERRRGSDGSEPSQPGHGLARIGMRARQGEAGRDSR
ncbi:MAG: hypothetical protein JRN06_03200 [Nitrososphaerota archaeon]|nr:hypothetical protein [Nitrososphaerota archaeon]MDG7023135.1 hypothetical protein [Nitrososphaerota archaeon]